MAAYAIGCFFVELYSEGHNRRLSVMFCLRKDAEAGLRPATLFKKRLWHRCIPVDFAKFLRTSFFIEHLRATASAAVSDLSIFETHGISLIRYSQSYINFIIFCFWVFLLVISTRFGMHENYEYYMNCKNRARNIDLFTADQVNLCCYVKLIFQKTINSPIY